MDPHDFRKEVMRSQMNDNERREPSGPQLFLKRCHVDPDDFQNGSQVYPNE